MAFIRRVRTGSGATAVQIAEYANGRQRIVEHVGSAHTEAELGVLLARARELLEDPARTRKTPVHRQGSHLSAHKEIPLSVDKRYRPPDHQTKLLQTSEEEVDSVRMCA